MKRRPLLFGLVLVVGVLAYWMFPVSWLAAPQWEVVVVDKHGKPVEGMTVRETWQNYSVETEGHEADRQTDANGHASFPAEKPEYSVLRQIGGTVSALVRLNVQGKLVDAILPGGVLSGSKSTLIH